MKEPSSLENESAQLTAWDGYAQIVSALLTDGKSGVADEATHPRSDAELQALVASAISSS